MYKFPMWKLFLLAALVLISTGVLATFDTTMHPTVAANLAVNQLENTESGAIAVRTYDRAQNVFPFIVPLATAFFGCLLFRADIVRLINYLRSTP